MVKFMQLLSSVVFAVLIMAVFSPISTYAQVDNEPPVVEIEWPYDGYETDEASIYVYGWVYDDVSTITTVTIDGIVVTVDSRGDFSATVPLAEGANLITVTAKDEAGNVGKATVTVTRVIYRVTGSTNIEFDMRRDGRCYFDVDGQLQAPGKIAWLATIPLWVVGAAAAPSVPIETLAVPATIAAVTIYYSAAPAPFDYYPPPQSTSTELPTLVSIEGDVTLEISSPTSGEFEFKANGWVMIPPEYKENAELAVLGFKMAPDMANAYLLQAGRMEIEEIREELPPELADLELRELKITDLDLVDNKLSFGLTASLSSQMFKKEELIKKIEETAWDENAKEQAKKFVEMIFERMPIKTSITFKLSVVDETISSQIDFKLYRDGEVLYELDTTFNASETSPGVYTVSFNAEAFKRGELLGNATMSLDVSEPDRHTSFELHVKTYEGGTEFYKIDATLDLSTIYETVTENWDGYACTYEVFKELHLDFDAEFLRRSEVLCRAKAKIEASENEGAFTLDLYSPEVSCTSEISFVGENFTVKANGWFDLPRVDDQIRWEAYAVENLLQELTIPSAELEELRGELAELEKGLHQALEYLDTTLTLKIPSEAGLVGLLPTGYRQVDSTYEWAGSAANDALVHLLMGRFPEIRYMLGLTKPAEELVEGQPKEIDFGVELPVRTVILVPKKNIIVEVKVIPIEKPPEIPDPPGISYTYLEVATDKPPELMESAEIKFKVEQSWIEQNSIDKATIKLLRYDDIENRWISLLTDILDWDENYLYCSAKTTGFSVFAISGGVAAAPVPKPIPWQFIGVGAAVVIVLIAALLYVKRRK